MLLIMHLDNKMMLWKRLDRTDLELDLPENTGQVLEICY